ACADVRPAAHHRRADRRGDRQGRRPAAPDDPGRARRDRAAVPAGGRGDGPRARPRRPAPADARRTPADRDRRSAARGHRPRRPAVDRGVGARSARGPAAGARRRAGLLQPDDGDDQLRRRRLPQPVAVRQGPLRAVTGAGGRPGVRAVRPRPRARAAPAAAGVRAALRRQGPLRPRHGGPWRDAGDRRRAGGGGRGAPRADDLVVGDGDRALDAHRRAGVPREGRPPAGRHGGRPHARPRRAGRAQRPAGTPGRRARTGRAARADDAGPGSDAARHPPGCVL
ncbi:MAG: 3-keto-5-aminohexanoate cleavage enzyme, partial [uncultured Nocardioidaceae bacterium]